jgi:hypothetical protein
MFPSLRTTPRQALLVGCGDAPEGPPVERIDSAGTELVSNRTGDHPAPVALERVFSVADTTPALSTADLSGGTALPRSVQRLSETLRRSVAPVRRKPASLPVRFR